ncbi:helix-turn-helix domain-containing protein [Streptomyces hirsutus]|uniref:helix-turn-helix domain-containing protein n=1 Tax=Streptomyces hirsutus TaxID=35620 RepID=UPI0036BA82FE
MREHRVERSSGAAPGMVEEMFRAALPVGADGQAVASDASFVAGMVVWLHRELPAEVRVPFPLVVERVTGVVLSRASVWRLLTSRLGWSLQRPERRAVERDESEIARRIAHEWPRIKKGR